MQFRYVRIQADTLNTTYFVIGEFELYMTSATTTNIFAGAGGTATSDAPYAVGFEPSKAFDQNTGTRFGTSGTGKEPFYLKYDFGSSTERSEIYKYAIRNHPTEATRHMVNWRIQVSTDDTNWTTLHTVHDSSGWTADELRTFQFYLVDNSNTTGVTVNGSETSGVNIYSFKKSDGSFLAHTTTDVNGDYNMTVPYTGAIIVVAADSTSVQPVAHITTPT